MVMEPLNVLLQCRDTEVLRAASLAVSNFALEGSEENRAVIVQSGSIPLLVNLLSSKNFEVQCNVCGCITTLATDGTFSQVLLFKYFS
jgi:vacuolar protein 8